MQIFLSCNIDMQNMSSIVSAYNSGPQRSARKLNYRFIQIESNKSSIECDQCLGRWNDASCTLYAYFVIITSNYCTLWYQHTLYFYCWPYKSKMQFCFRNFCKILRRFVVFWPCRNMQISVRDLFVGTFVTILFGKLFLTMVQLVLNHDCLCLFLFSCFFNFSFQEHCIKQNNFSLIIILH